MKNKKVVLLSVLVLILSLALTAPAMAYERFSLSVNGDAAGMFEIYGEKGVSFMPVEVFARIAGADASLTPDGAITIEENANTLSMTIGEKEALFNGEPVTMPAAPLKIEGEVFVPLRFVCGTFGFEVKWNDQQRLIMLNREETRDGVSPIDLLVKSTVATQEINTYSMIGNASVSMDMVADGKKMSETPFEISVDISGQVQSEPMEIYMKQTMNSAGPADMPGTTVETYMTTEKMYMKIPDKGWVVQDMPFPQEFLKQQQDIQSNPILAAQQMKEMGLFLNYDNDTTIDGTDYYVVNATLDMEKFRQGLPALMQQAMQGLQTQDENAQQNLQKILENMKMDYYYTVYINKETMITDVIDFNAMVEMDMSNLGDMAEDDTGNKDMEMPDSLLMKMDIKGQFKVFDAGKPFTAPDVSEAQELSSLQESAGQQ